MSEPFVGEIRMFAGNFAPEGWALCDGQLLAVNQHDALFSLLGTIYGGDGRTTFGLPDMRGRLPIHQGQGPGLSDRRIGQKVGTENVALTWNQNPSHNHTLASNASAANASSRNPGGNLVARAKGDIYQEAVGASLVNMNAQSTSSTGGGQSHNNVQPFLCVNFIIALQGVFPSRS